VKRTENLGAAIAKTGFQILEMPIFRVDKYFAFDGGIPKSDTGALFDLFRLLLLLLISLFLPFFVQSFAFLLLGIFLGVPRFSHHCPPPEAEGKLALKPSGFVTSAPPLVISVPPWAEQDIRKPTGSSFPA